MSEIPGPGGAGPTGGATGWAGRRRRVRTTRRSVLVVDRIADWGISLGGLGVILAVAGIMVFLAQVVVPLFAGGRLTLEHSVTLGGGGGPPPLAFLTDEYRSLAVTVAADGTVRALHPGSGREVEGGRFETGAGTAAGGGRHAITASALVPHTGDLMLGLDDGRVIFGRVRLAAAVLAPGDAPDGLEPLEDPGGGGAMTDGKAVYTPAPGGQLRRTWVELHAEAPVQVAPRGVPVVAADYRVGGNVERPTRAFVTLGGDGVLRLSRASSKKNLLTGKVRTRVRTTKLPPIERPEDVLRVLMTEAADQVYVLETDGTLYRFDTRDFSKPVLAEKTRVTPEGVELTAATFLIGEQSLVVGAEDGSVDVYFRVERPQEGGTDGFRMVRAHALEPHRAPVRMLSPSQRSKLFVSADAAGTVLLRHSTSEQTVLEIEPERPAAWQALVLAPRDDGVLALGSRPGGGGTLWHWGVHAPHPETTLKSLFGKVWYEGYPEPTWTWQSSSGEDSFEPKLSLVPLIFGTIKATVYSLLFAVPIALFSAVYTSEFVHHRVRSVLKPTMEMMASLPSVVLGFIAALVLAPIVETWIAAVVLAFAVMPLALIGAAYLWQLVPAALAQRVEGLPKLALVLSVLVLALWGAHAAGPLFERLFFAGDLKAWANGDIGSPAPFLALLLFPLVFVLLWLAHDRWLGEEIEARMRTSPRTRAALIDLGRWVAVLAGSGLLAGGLAVVLGALGVDARGGIVGTYVQRNTLVVGFAMGFAVIPIIYTIAEDALNAVPEHLRAGSLACGATPWQTAVTVILPTAFSGVFAAIMIGMGRAVGETMIVVMAAGNTPVMEWNVFSGLRALSANIAVELPEAVKDGTLYRVLFLAALVLFVMTFVVNTVAEIVRLRFRERASNL